VDQRGLALVADGRVEDKVVVKTTRLRNGQDPARDSSLGSHLMSARANDLTEAERATLEMLRYWRLLRHRILFIAGATIAVSLAVGCYTKFFATKVYRAKAVVTPVAPSQSWAGTSGVAPGENFGAGMGALLGFGAEGDNALTSQRYIAIMHSYAFTTELVKRYQLRAKLLKDSGEKPPKVSDWQLYRKLGGSFQTDYDYKSGNMTLYFFDPDPRSAKQMLGYYLENLRDKLRNAEIRTAAGAATSLQDEIDKTSDALLRNQLYELMARQIQRAKIAQVQADFAFKVVEPPVVPDHYYSPSARRAAMLWGAITLFVLCSWVLLGDFLRRARATLAADELGDSAPPAGNSEGASRLADDAQPAQEEKLPLQH